MGSKSQGGPVMRPKPKPKTYDWLYFPDLAPGMHPECFQAVNSMCFVDLVEADTLSTFHDERLKKVTEEINSILERAKAANKDESKCLRFLNTPKGLFLAWTTKAFGPSDEEQDELCNRLGI